MRVKATAAALGAVAIVALAGCGGTTSPGVVAEEIGAESCKATTWYLESRFTGDKEIIYDCVINGAHRCITYDGSVAQDETDFAIVFFEDVLSSGRPSCIEGY